MKRGFKAEANRIALRVRRELDLKPTDPLNPFDVCDHFDIEVRPLSHLGKEAAHFLNGGRSNFSAVTVPCGLRRAIVHNDTHVLARQHSNVMHELAHGFLRHQPCQAFDCDGERAYDSGIEQEANFLAGCLLISNEAAWHIVRNGLTSGATSIYEVSRQMLDWRLRVSGARIRGERYARKVGA